MNDRTPPGQSPDPVVEARQKYHCAACGAEAVWNPAKQKLVCPFCGTESTSPLEGRTPATVIVEHDLLAALGAAPSSARGWNAEKRSVQCQSCRAISVLDPDKVGTRCQFCGSTQLVPYTETHDTFRPESLLPLHVSEGQARDLIRAWYGRQWFAPNALGRRALTDTVTAVYLPYWTFDARAHAEWTADSGRYYYTTDRGRRERHVDWTPASGELDHIFDDDLVPASQGVAPQWLHGVEPFPTGALVPYDPGYLAGWTVERYQIDLAAAAQAAHAEMEAELNRLCAAEVPGDTYRNLHVNATFTNQTFKHILVPVWLLTYTYGPRSYQVVINGVTGAAAGGRPWSWIKLTLLAIAIVLALLIYLSITNNH